MGSMTYKEAEIHILTAYFQQEPGDFGPFYIGLGVGAVPMDENLTLADISEREIAGSGYSRKIINRDDSSQGWAVFSDDSVNSPEIIFTNTSYTTWDPIGFAFLTLSPLGTESPSLLIAAIDFKHSIILTPGKQTKFNFRFSYNHANFMHQRVLCAQSSVVGRAFLGPSAFGNSLSGIASMSANTDLFYAVDPPTISGQASVVGSGGVELQPYPDAGINAAASSSAVAVCFP